jgi:hypothetical protein
LAKVNGAILAEKVKTAAMTGGYRGRVAEGALALKAAELAPRLVVDQTGLGLPIIELVREEVWHAGLRVPVTGAIFRQGASLRGRLGDPELSSGKERLVSGLTALMENDRLRLPAQHPLTGVLERGTRLEVATACLEGVSLFALWRCGCF